MTKTHCYDCGHDQLGSFLDDPSLLLCRTCGEIVYPHERIGLVRALIRRLLFPRHSNTGDPAARGWRNKP